MKNPNFKPRGFTLIELLVVITIIGILATGAATVYTSAQQKARDSIRQQHLIALQKAIELDYSDEGQYIRPEKILEDETSPDGTSLIEKNYMTSIPADPKSGEEDVDTLFHYIYAAAYDEGTQVAGQLYELSANFENSGNKGKEEEDNGNELTRWELGVGVGSVSTTDPGAPKEMGQNPYSVKDTADTEAVILDPAVPATP
jgi:general secretion pathway protein G